MVLDASLLNTQYYKVQIKGKWSNPGKKVAPPQQFVVAIQKGVLGLPSSTVGQLTIYTTILSENRKFHVSKYLYEYSIGIFKIMPIDQTDEYSLLKIKEKNFMDKFKPTLNRA